MRLPQTALLAVVVFFFYHYLPVTPKWHRGTDGVDEQVLASSKDGKLLQRPLWWHGPFFSDTGYGFEAELLYKEITKTSERLRLFQWGAKESLQVLATMSRDTRDRVFALMDMDELKPDYDAIILCHQQPDFYAVPRPPPVEGIFCPPIPSQDAAYVIGRSMLGADQLEPERVHACNLMHEIWVPSEYTREAYRKAGVFRPQLSVIPGAVDTDNIFNPDLHLPLELPVGKLIFGTERVAPGRPFVFLSVFEWHERDGWDILLRAFLEEFRVDATGDAQQPDVVLLMVTKAMVINKYVRAIELPDEELIWQIHNWTIDHHLAPAESHFGELPRVYLAQKHLLDPQLAHLLKSADAFVHPRRGEAFERRHMAAMSMGLPVIATNWGETTDILDKSTGYPIAVEQFTPVPEHLAVNEGQVWPKPSVLHLRQLMRHVVENRGDAVAKGKAARARVLRRSAPGVVGGLVASRLAAINKLLQIGNATLQWQAMGQFESLVVTENEFNSDEF